MESVPCFANDGLGEYRAVRVSHKPVSFPDVEERADFSEGSVPLERVAYLECAVL